ncbi:sugar phosphate isomerase family [Christensenella tenuis]|jgi:glucosamine-6-phosphate deaminase|uniref:Glucosamine-6-phosphate isomerase n=1 Tax=Christensenella tenuis TaxID=2763033 RepID=A0ABR7EDL2_9FIRM|nr:glucosamine-6-phosphate isomerase [Christensenella tenuis]MBC5647164.1 glucosamine-6-phosphate isomerase [Christensenella tenuis]
MDLLSTIKNSNMEHFYPAGWDLKRIDECCSYGPEEVTVAQPFWNEKFRPVACENADAFAVMMGHEIALTIKKAKDCGKKLALIFPVGPMGMYRWAVYFLKEWNVDCRHVTGFNMDEWSDEDGNTLDPNARGSFQNAMMDAFYGPLGELTVPENQRNFATKQFLPHYAEKIEEIRREGGELVTVYGIGRVFHIAFWEPHFAADYKDEAEWRQQTHRFGAKLHPLTIEQNALHSFKSRTTQVPAFANTIGPGLFLKSDKMIGGCDGTYNRDLMWQGMSFWVALRYGPDMWVPASFVPTLPGKLFYIKELGGPLEADCK